MGERQGDWMWVCVSAGVGGVLWLMRRECVVWFFFFVFGFGGPKVMSEMS